MSYERRPYQEQVAADAGLKLDLGCSKLVVVAPTGAGKTVIATNMIGERKSSRHLVLAHRRELVHQTGRKLAEAGLQAGIVMAGVYPNLHHGIQVASIDTLLSWVDNSTMQLPQADYIWPDEAHRSISRKFRRVLDHYVEQGSKIIGLTATPIRGDGAGLGRFYDDIVQTPGTAWMVENGYLVPARYYVPNIPDLSGVKIVGGDYDKKILAEIMDQQHLVGDVVTNWLRICPDRKTFVFACGVAHSIHLCERFQEAGINAAHIDGHTPTDKRDRILHALSYGDLQVVCNDSVFVEGTDVPAVSCIVSDRPTRSLSRYLQYGGRGLRTFPGKDDCVFIDHTGAYHSFGTHIRDITWTLGTGRKIKDQVAQAREHERKDFTCKVCHTVFSGRVVCPECGTRIERVGRYLDYLDSELVEMTNGKWDANVPGTIAKAHFYTQLMHYAIEKKKDWDDDKRAWWCGKTFSDKYHEAAPRRWRGFTPRTPTPETLAYIKSRNIAYGHRKKKEKENA